MIIQQVLRLKFSIIRIILVLIGSGLFFISLNAQSKMVRKLEFGASLDYTPLMKLRDDPLTLSKGQGIGFSVSAIHKINRIQTKIRFSGFKINSDINGKATSLNRSFITLSTGYLFYNKKRFPRLEFPISLLIGLRPNYFPFKDPSSLGIEIGVHYIKTDKINIFFEVSNLSDWITNKNTFSIKNLFVFSVGMKYNVKTY